MTLSLKSKKQARTRVAADRLRLICADKMTQEPLSRHSGFAVNGTEDHTFVRLAIQHDRPIACSEDEGDNGKIFFPVNDNGGGGIPDRMLQRAD